MRVESGQSPGNTDDKGDGPQEKESREDLTVEEEHVGFPREGWWNLSGDAGGILR